MPVSPAATPGLLNACIDAALADARRWASGRARHGATIALLAEQQSGTKLRPWQQATNRDPRAHRHPQTQGLCPDRDVIYC